ncbi:hypothetical protein GIY62_20015 [Burkholderia plantarii]|uniref:hypothetical protein n=1 Tax=Burkholderia plantarii TaxID=41899 RepID=UPI00272C75C5|nr:hypothetical protein [Burkholderia plantarii]WLE62685.1 hypothetical protein GIY62_20015 [Burkholderia plantarii]
MKTIMISAGLGLVTLLQGCATMMPGMQAYDGPARPASEVATLLPDPTQAQAVRSGTLMIQLVTSIKQVDDSSWLFGFPSKVDALPGKHTITAHCGNGDVAVDSSVSPFGRAFVRGWINMGHMSFSAEPATTADLEAGHSYTVACYPAPYSFVDDKARVVVRVLDNGLRHEADPAPAIPTADAAKSL